MSSNFVFDQPHYDALNAAREAIIRSLVESLRKDHTLQSAVDLGCGVGHFSGFLRDLGFNVLALDGRQANLDEARRRFPGIEFRLMDAEDPQVRNLGQFDLVLCMGLYYHLENPFAAFRNCFAITGRIAIVEGMCVPGSDPSLTVRDEGPMEDQGLHHVALYPTENGLIKLLYRSGFPFVYRFRKKPDHPNYENSSLSRQMRTMVVASITPLASGLLETAPEPVSIPDPWALKTTLARARRGMARAWRFVHKPAKEKASSIFFRWSRLFPSIPVPVRLPFGAVWLARRDFIGAALFYSGFENTEGSFVDRFLHAGMNVVDIGAHHGYYTLLASRKVGPRGSVLAIEASPRERRALRLHVRINRCRNVQIEDRALGESEGSAELFVVRGTETGCNSLRKPNVSEPTEVFPVTVARLDRVLQQRKFESVDFIKLDVEGAELSVLKGAEKLLGSPPRPVILIEVQDIRTKPWGYQAREIVQYLSSINYRWFSPLSDGRLEKLDEDLKEYDGNFVAVPEEQLGSVSDLIMGTASVAATAK